MKGLSRQNECLTQFYIAHTLDKQGYQSTWYDAIDVPDKQFAYYYAKIPKSDGPLYFIIETYTRDVVPVECTKGSYTQPGGMKLGVTHPLAYI